MSTSVLHLPGLTARIDGGLLIEVSGEDPSCGRNLVLAKEWLKYVAALESRDQGRAPLGKHPSAALREMQKLETDVRRDA